LVSSREGPRSVPSAAARQPLQAHTSHGDRICARRRLPSLTAAEPERNLSADAHCGLAALSRSETHGCGAAQPSPARAGAGPQPLPGATMSLLLAPCTGNVSGGTDGTLPPHPGCLLGLYKCSEMRIICAHSMSNCAGLGGGVHGKNPHVELVQHRGHPRPDT